MGVLIDIVSVSHIIQSYLWQILVGLILVLLLAAAITIPLVLMNLKAGSDQTHHRECGRDTDLIIRCFLVSTTTTTTSTTTSETTVTITTATSATSTTSTSRLRLFHQVILVFLFSASRTTTTTTTASML
jgi:uncharacterized membrane protein